VEDKLNADDYFVVIDRWFGSGGERDSILSYNEVPVRPIKLYVCTLVRAIPDENIEIFIILSPSYKTEVLKNCIAYTIHDNYYNDEYYGSVAYHSTALTTKNETILREALCSFFIYTLIGILNFSLLLVGLQ